MPGNMPLTAKICLEILCNCQLLCLLIFILMLPKHVHGIAQMGEEKTVIECTEEALPEASNWASLCTFAHLPPGTQHCCLIEMNISWGVLL